MERCAHVFVGKEGVFRLTPHPPPPVPAILTLDTVVSLVGASTSIVFVATKHCFLATKRMLVMTKVSSRKNHNKYNFVSINVLSRQAYFCCDKHVFVATKIMLSAAPANDTVVPFYLCLD